MCIIFLPYGRLESAGFLVSTSNVQLKLRMLNQEDFENGDRHVK